MGISSPGITGGKRTGVSHLYQMIAAASVVFLSFLLSSCHFCQPWGSVLIFPPAPCSHWEQFEENISYCAEYFDLDGELKSVTIDNEGTPLLLPKRDNVSILVYPVIDFDGEMDGMSVRGRPAGAVYPLHCGSREQLYPEYQNGPMCSILQDLHAAGYPVELLDVQEMELGINGSSGNRGIIDLWRLDRDRIITMILHDTFRRDRIRWEELYSVFLDADPGMWVPLNPLASGLCISKEGSEVTFYPGIHRFVKNKNTLSISVDKQGVSLFMVSR